MKNFPSYSDFVRQIADINYLMGILSATTIQFRVKYPDCIDMSDIKRIEEIKNHVQKGHTDSKRVIMALNRIEQKLKKKCEEKETV